MVPYLGYTIVILVLLFLLGNYFVFGTPYSNERNCSEIEIGDSSLYVIWKLGIPSYTYKEKSGVRVFGYPIHFASYEKVPKNEISLLNSRVISKVCMIQ